MKLSFTATEDPGESVERLFDKITKSKSLELCPVWSRNENGQPHHAFTWKERDIKAINLYALLNIPKEYNLQRQLGTDLNDPETIQFANLAGITVDDIRPSTLKRKYGYAGWRSLASDLGLNWVEVDYKRSTVKRRRNENGEVYSIEVDIQCWSGIDHRTLAKASVEHPNIEFKFDSSCQFEPDTVWTITGYRSPDFVDYCKRNGIKTSERDNVTRSFCEMYTSHNMVLNNMYSYINGKVWDARMDIIHAVSDTSNGRPRIPNNRWNVPDEQVDRNGNLIQTEGQCPRGDYEDIRHG